MTQDLAGLIGGALLAIAAMAYVVHPLFSGPRVDRAAERGPDHIDERVRALRSRHPRCRTCGVRPEGDAIFCSSCGRRIASEA